MNAVYLGKEDTVNMPPSRDAVTGFLSVASAAALIVALAVGAARGGLPDNGPTNAWTRIGQAPQGANRVHTRLVWLPDQRRGLLWPNLNFGSRRVSFEDHARLHLFDPAAGEWTVRTGAFPEGKRIEPEIVGNSCAYLPGIRRVIFLCRGSRGNNTTADSWLLDPGTGQWEATAENLRMTDASADFNPAKGNDGFSLPVWGTLCYDGLNGEAVSIGGGGTWGRVGASKEKVTAGDWIYDEAASPKRIRRLTARDVGAITEARKWYPSNCGTWVFSEATRTWSALEQPISGQPSGRVLPAAAYDAGERKIVAFGGDDLARCLDDTWVYDCASRTWREARPAASPPARVGAAMVYVPDLKAVLLAGGYATGWAPLKDTWLYETAANRWTRLAAELPQAVYYCSAVYEAERKMVLLCASPTSKGGRQAIYALPVGAGPLAKAPAPAQKPTQLTYHCQADRWSQPAPEEWTGEKNKPSDPETVRKDLADLPANTWVLLKPPVKPRARVWGKYAYDPRTQKGYAWGGGHGGYPGADVAEYDLLTNRWVGQVDPPDFKHLWRHGSSGDAPPGVTYRGIILMQSHARKSYDVDPLSRSLITSHGDVYGIADRTFVACIGRCPGKWGWGDQVTYVSTPHGLYAYHSGNGGLLHRANVAAGKWDLIARGGPPRHSEHNPICYDTNRNRLIYANCRDATLWAFDFATGTWSQEKPVGKAPRSVAGDPAYVPRLDAVVFVCSQERRGKPSLFVYRCGERRWETAPYNGNQLGSFGTLNNSTAYDPDLNLLVRLTHVKREWHVEVVVMRLDAASLGLIPVD